MNLFVGCHGIGCAVGDNCWARRMAKRQHCQLCKSFTPHYHGERWVEPFRVRKSSRIGLNFMSDTFDRDVVHHLSFHEMMVMIEKCDWHTFIVLTKQPQNIPGGLFAPNNLWIGVSINTVGDLWRLADLKARTNIKHKFVSFEPLYEDLTNANLSELEWIIIGAQTRPEKQPKPEWVESLVTQANEKKIPVFLKNNLRGFEKVQEYPQSFSIQLSLVKRRGWRSHLDSQGA